MSRPCHLARALRDNPRSWVAVLSRCVAAACAVLTLAATGTKGSDPNEPPVTRRRDVSEVLHGVTVTDPYRWLEDQQSPETRAWIEAENAYTQSFLAKWPGREQVKHRLAELMKIETVGVPLERQGRYFFSKRLASQDLFVIYMRKGMNGQDEVLIDPHSLSSDHSTSVTLEDVAMDGRVLAYGVRQGGRMRSLSGSWMLTRAST